MKDRSKAFGFVDSLESRTLFSVAHPELLVPVYVAPTLSAAVKADLALIKTDGQNLAKDVKALAPVLEADRKAVDTAIQTEKTTKTTAVYAAFTKLQTDGSTVQTTLTADFAAIAAAHKSGASVSALLTKLRTDEMSGFTLLQADEKALQTAINGDPVITAAKIKLRTDSAPLTADHALLAAAENQLLKDLKAEFHPTPTPTPTPASTT